jgi:hypothetical protein
LKAADKPAVFFVFRIMAIKVTVTSKGKVSSGQIKNLALAGLDRGLILAGQLVAQRAAKKAPVDTGRLQRSITYGHSTGQVIQQGRPYSRPGGKRAIDIGTNVEYARIQEFGGTIKSIVVTPRNASVLAFKWPNAPAELPAGKGGLHFFKKVTLPQRTLKAQPYLRPAIRMSEKDIVKIIGNSVVGAMNS